MTIVQQIEKKARQEGKQEARQETLYAVAEELLKEGNTIDFIEKITKLKRGEIVTLKEKLTH